MKHPYRAAHPARKAEIKLFSYFCSSKTDTMSTLIEQADFAKGEGLLPVIVQDASTHKVLMLGYMNQAALEKTLAEERVTFFSRNKNRLWLRNSYP